MPTLTVILTKSNDIVSVEVDGSHHDELTFDDQDIEDIIMCEQKRLKREQNVSCKLYRKRRTETIKLKSENVQLHAELEIAKAEIRRLKDVNQ